MTVLPETSEIESITLTTETIVAAPEIGQEVRQSLYVSRDGVIRFSSIVHGHERPYVADYVNSYIDAKHADKIIERMTEGVEKCKQKKSSGSPAWCLLIVDTDGDEHRFEGRVDADDQGLRKASKAIRRILKDSRKEPARPIPVSPAVMALFDGGKKKSD